MSQPSTHRDFITAGAIAGARGMASNTVHSRVEGVNQPMHQVMLYAVGTPLIDNCDLESVAEATSQRRRWTFLLTLNPLRVPGATGSPANPIAVF